MAMKRKSKGHKADVPGTIYLNKNRYWWKVQLPGEAKPKARPLKAPAAKFATTDLPTAVEIARNLWQTAIYAHSRPETVTEVTNIASLTAAYLRFVDSYYLTPEGKVTQEPDNIRYSLAPLTARFASLAVEEFGPLRLIEVRNEMIRLKWSRKLINQRIGRIKRMFKWAVSRQMISPIIYHGLMTVEGLKWGRTTARETADRRPVAEEHVYAILPYMTPVVAAMVEIQLLTGMRPGEVCRMRPCDLDRSREVWHYLPEKHKNRYRKIQRIVSIGPRGQEILTPFLLRPAESYCFSPAEADRQRREKLTQERQTPQSCGNTVGSNRKENPLRKPGEAYDTAAYAKAVKYAISAANKEIKRKAKAAEIKDPELIPHWTPYQLRHTAATKVRKEMGYECAGATLGHTNMSATAIYAERNQGLADQAALRFG